MDNLTINPVDISLTLDSRLPLPHRSDNTATAVSPSARDSDEQGERNRTSESDARKAANKFEALLIHSMLKSMRKTTMSENKSNDRAIYDDMLDEKLADTMMAAGGMGISDQIVTQIRQQQGVKSEAAVKNTDLYQLQALATKIPVTDSVERTVTASSSQTNTNASTTDVSHLQLANRLWGNSRNSELNQEQTNFIETLLPHAKRNAEKLGTSSDAILAIAALETGWGKSHITDKQGNASHNLFGIKAIGSDNRYATTLTTEYIEGSPQKLQARFKTYDSPADSVDGFADFLLTNPRYSKALNHAANPEAFIRELQAAGYATDPRYADKAISIMRQIARNPMPL